jgi:pyroglutamyl-peptidase
MAAILVTGFGRFPGVPINPTAGLVARLGRSRRAALSGVRIKTHVFATRYAAVDDELPALIAREQPDAVVLFGVAARAKNLRIELFARNRVSVLPPDASRARSASAIIARGAPPWQRGRFPPHRLLAAIRSTGLRACLSHNAGAYLCNYAYWRALETAARAGGPRIVVFVHIPPRSLKAKRRHAGQLPHSLGAMARGAEALLAALPATLRGSDRRA